MSDRTYRLILGALLLTALYTDTPGIILGLIALLVAEGVSNTRIPELVTRLRQRWGFVSTACPAGTPTMGGNSPRFRFEAERAWRLVVAVLLLIGLLGLHSILWFLPWFMGFGIFGAGVSGVCPILTSIEWLGFR
ncbi:MAG: hypothetical protein ACYDEV_08340 [Acidiferrobacter sp.]